ncbi:MAG: hypothetical protein M3Y60_03055 [Bacteroidota bacterium]|nr:hypothetical protein [Bacteroidota bacterium]
MASGSAQPLIILEKLDETAPKAFLTWLVFDRDFNPLIEESGFVQLGSSGVLPKENGSNVAHELLKRTTPLKIKQTGYVYIYLSNENETPVEVFFDDFKVEQIKSPVIQTNVLDENGQPIIYEVPLYEVRVSGYGEGDYVSETFKAIRFGVYHNKRTGSGPFVTRDYAGVYAGQWEKHPKLGDVIGCWAQETGMCSFTLDRQIIMCLALTAVLKYLVPVNFNTFKRLSTAYRAEQMK